MSKGEQNSFLTSGSLIIAKQCWKIPSKDKPYFQFRKVVLTVNFRFPPFPFLLAVNFKGVFCRKYNTNIKFKYMCSIFLHFISPYHLWFCKCVFCNVLYFPLVRHLSSIFQFEVLMQINAGISRETRQRDVNLSP